VPGKRYPDVLAQVYRRLAEEWELGCDQEDAEAYGQSVADWPAFPDSFEALAYLKQHYELIILSNVDQKSFAQSNAKLGVAFDAIYTAEDVGSYKPNDANFEYMLRHAARLGLASSDILHTAESLFHDHVPARKFGLANCHIFRRHDDEGTGATAVPDHMPERDFVFHSMAEMADAHRQLL
jgi:2-haloalkanoic acid dehalogenase type II